MIEKVIEKDGNKIVEVHSEAGDLLLVKTKEGYELKCPSTKKVCLISYKQMMSDCLSCWAEVPSGKDNPFFGEPTDVNPAVNKEIPTNKKVRSFWKALGNITLWALAICVGAALVWQGVTSSGAPDPTAENLNTFSIIMNAGILVFREGLEAILVLSALTVSLVRTGEGYWKPIGLGAGLSFLASIATWFIVVGIISNINAPALDIQAGTGLLAVVVLLVIMNWFFHKIYWTGWISLHNQRKQKILSKPSSDVFKGLIFLGFTSVYREGFEIVLFLQSLRLKAGSEVVLYGVLIGLALTAMVGVLTFVGHKKLPYRKMLVVTGFMLGVVLMVMVGESVQEMQLANWIGTTTLNIHLPSWLNIWFAIYPSAESLIAQCGAVTLVLGSYLVSQYISIWRPRQLQARRETIISH